MPKTEIRVTGLEETDFKKLKLIAEKEKRSVAKQAEAFLEKAIRDYEKIEEGV